MKIISKYKDYYDFAIFEYARPLDDYKEKIYNREFLLKAIEYDFEPIDFDLKGVREGYDGWDKRYYSDIKSKWWNKIKAEFGFESATLSINCCCLFVCGKAFPFLELKVKAPNIYVPYVAEIKLVLAKSFDGTAFKELKDSEIKEWAKTVPVEFSKAYFSYEEFVLDVDIVEPTKKSTWYYRENKDINKKIKYFFESYKKDYTDLHIKLDCPIAMISFDTEKRWNYNGGANKYANSNHSVACNPYLAQYNFMRIMPAPIIYQEIEMFLGNALVKDLMPPSHQSDLDKVTAKGFCPKTSFRKAKTKL